MGSEACPRLYWSWEETANRRSSDIQDMRNGTPYLNSMLAVGGQGVAVPAWI